MQPIPEGVGFFCVKITEIPSHYSGLCCISRVHRLLGGSFVSDQT